MERTSQYHLGRHQVPVDVCRTRMRPNSPPTGQPTGQSRESRDGGDGVPEFVDREHESTAPLDVEEPRGPSHDELRALGEGECESLLLAGRYELHDRIGRGGMATVYRGRALALDRPVAIKVLDDERGHRDDGLARFIAEARTTARVRGPNVVEVLDFGTTAEGVVYLVMELLDGEDLRQTLRRQGPLPWFVVQGIMLQICAGLSAIHAGGVIHRDLKPANCFCVPMEDDVRIKLLDFGIATRPGLREHNADRPTEDGRVVGTPEYMSPEQARDEAIDQRSDVYAAGIILGEMLTGRVPFEGRTATAVIAKQIYERAPKLRELAEHPLEIPASVEAIYAKALDKHPAGRFSSAAELGRAIAAVGTERRPWWRSFAAAAAAMLTVA